MLILILQRLIFIMLSFAIILKLAHFQFFPFIQFHLSFLMLQILHHLYLIDKFLYSIIIFTHNNLIFFIFQ